MSEVHTIQRTGAEPPPHQIPGTGAARSTTVVAGGIVAG
jgi:hypothetical protein